MNAREFGRRLDNVSNVPSAGGWFSALCPAHDDRTPSLSFKDGGDGEVRVKCFAGCTGKAIFAAWRSLADGDEDASAEKRGKRELGPVVKRYDYFDEKGKLLRQVQRHEPKDFSQRRPDGKGGWIEGKGAVKGVRRVPYRLPELKGQWCVFITEGEKDVDRLFKLKIPATTNDGGAKKWADELSEELKECGAEYVVILPDNDDSGREHAAKVKASCLKAGLRVTVLDLPDLPDKGDVSDWLEAGGTATELIDLAGAADEEQPDGAVLTQLSDVEPEAIKWIWPGHLAEGKLTIISGDPGLGKSMLTCDLTARITTGKEWPDGEAAAPVSDVVILSAEDAPGDTIAPRVMAHGGNRDRVWVVQAIRSGGKEHWFTLANDLPALERAVMDKKAKLVFIDPLSAYLGGKDSYRDNEMRELLGPLSKLAERTGACVVGIMHNTKDTNQRAMYRAQGSIAFVAAARMSFVVGKNPRNVNEQVILSLKVNVAAKTPPLGFKIAEEELENGIKIGKITWTGAVEGVTVEQVLGFSGLTQADLEVDRFLQERLADAPVPAAEMLDEAKELGFTKGALKRGRDRNRVETERVDGLGGEGKWMWSLDKAKRLVAARGEEV